MVPTEIIGFKRIKVSPFVRSMLFGPNRGLRLVWKQVLDDKNIASKMYLNFGHGNHCWSTAAGVTTFPKCVLCSYVSLLTKTQNICSLGRRTLVQGSLLNVSVVLSNKN